MAWLAAGAGVVGNVLGANAAGKAAKRADQRLQEGRDYAINQSGLGTFRDNGVAAANTQQGLLGIGGDPAAAQQAYNNYLASSGYQTQLQGGVDALNSSAAARGLLKSGATLKGTQQFGSGLANSYFNSYLGQVSDVAGRGMSAADSLARTVTGTAGAQAANQQQLGDTVGNAYASTGSLIGKTLAYGAGGKGALGIFS